MKNERISHFAEYAHKRLRPLMVFFRRLGGQKRTSDQWSGSKPETIMLRERTWRIEVSGKNAKLFWKRHRVAIVAVLAVALAGIATRYVLIGFASTADFYPSSCLGNWENVENALGKPSLPAGSPMAAFTTLNSAFFGTSTAQMFCGNFVGDTDIHELTGKSFEEADLVLSWTFAFPQAQPTAAPGAGGGGGGDLISPSASSSDASSPDDASMQAAPTSTDETSSLPSDDASPVPSSSTPDAGGTPTPVPADASSSVSAPSSDTGDTTNATPPPPPADTNSDTVSPAPPATDGTDSGASPTSWLKKLVGIAYADDASSSIAIDASTTELAVDSSTPLTDASSAEQGTPNVPEPAPISVNTSVFQNIAVPTSTANAVLAIVYSTDGATWQPLVNIDSSNWQQARYRIPIASWQELEHLQVAFVGLGASSSPPVYLDAAGVEVSYMDTPDATTEIAPATDTLPTGPSGPFAAPMIVPPTPVELPPAQALKQVFDPFAKQLCSVAPFSESVVAGRGGSFLLKLTPPAASTSSASSSSPQQAPSGALLYDASIGSLPDGISATIVPEKAGADMIGVNTTPDVTSGSYNIVVVYKERQRDGTVEPNFCQFNLIVTQ